MAEVADNAGSQRYEMVVNGATAMVDYAREGDRIVLLHTEVAPALSGQGIGSVLVRAVLEELRRRGLKVVVECPFIAAFIERHPGFADLVAEPPPDGMV